MGFVMATELKGSKQMVSALRTLHNTLERRLKSAIYQEANYVLTDSKENYVPVDLSTLANSGFVTKPSLEDGAYTVTIGFGGAASEYAIVVHEHPSNMDPPSWRGKVITFKPSGRGPKYLTIPLTKAMSGMLSRIGNALKSG